MFSHCVHNHAMELPSSSQAHSYKQQCVQHFGETRLHSSGSFITPTVKRKNHVGNHRTNCGACVNDSVVTQSIAATTSDSVVLLNGLPFCGVSTSSRDDPSIHLSLFLVLFQCTWAVFICTKIYRPTVFRATVHDL